MRVLNCLTDNRIGGPQIRSLSIARLLRERGIETIFLFPPGDDMFEEQLLKENFSVYRPNFSCVHPPKDILSNANYVLTFPLSVRNILGCINEIDPDLIHVNMSFNFHSALSAYLSEAKMIWHLNDVNAPWPISRIVAKSAQILSDSIVVSSNWVDEYYFPNKRVSTETIYPIVDTEIYDPERKFDNNTTLREELNLDSSIPIVGSVGNINPTKGYEYLLRAVRNVMNTYGKINVIIVGKKLDTQQEYYHSLKRLQSELRLKDAVYFLGRRSDIPQLLSEFDAFVMPSVTETGPMTLMEAMAMQKPVVTTNVGVVPEQFVHREHGFVVPPEDAESLGRALTELLNSTDQNIEYGRNARKRAIEAFSVKNISDRYVDIYRSTLSG